MRQIPLLFITLFLNLTAIAQQAEDSNTHVVLQVGTNSQYKTLNTAIEYLKSQNHNHLGSADIVLTSGFIIEEQLLVKGNDLSWISISSEDSHVIVNRESINQSYALQDYDDGTIPVFGVSNGGKLPKISTIFDMNGHGEKPNIVGIAVIGTNSSALIAPGAGFINAAWHNFYVSAGGSLNASRAIGTGAANNCLHVRGPSKVEAPKINCRNSFHSGMNAIDGAIVNVPEGNFSDSGTEGGGHHGIWASTGAFVNATGSICTNAGKDGISASLGAIILATDADVSNAARYGLFAWRSAEIIADGANAQKAGVTGVYAESQSRINFEGGDASHANEKGIYAARASEINALAANSRTGESDSENDTVIWAGSSINFVYGTGGTSERANRFTSNGIIYK